MPLTERAKKNAHTFVCAFNRVEIETDKTKSTLGIRVLGFWELRGPYTVSKCRSLYIDVRNERQKPRFDTHEWHR